MNLKLPIAESDEPMATRDTNLAQVIDEVYLIYQTGTI